MDDELTPQQWDDIYEVLGRCQQVLKHQEQARAALQMTDKPVSYSPLVVELMRVRGWVGDRAAAARAQQAPPG